MTNAGIPGMAAAVVYNGQVVYIKGYGARALDDAAPVDEDTIFQIGSTSKAFTSALTAMMVDEGKFAWTDRVMDRLPDFRVYDAWVTREFQIRDLMAQHSGMPAYAMTLPPFMGFPPSLVLESMRLTPPETSFRADFAYQNCLFETAGALVEKYTGRGLADAFQQRIFDPLGMTRSTCRVPEAAGFGNVSGLHLTWGGRVIQLPRDNPLRDWTERYLAAGGVNSSVRDMAQWVKFHLNGGKWGGRQLISAANLDYVHRPRTIISVSDKAVFCYSQGWIYQVLTYPHPFIGHNGDTNYAHAFVGLMPAENLGIVILCNLGQTRVPDQLGAYFMDLYFGTASSEALAVQADQAPALDAGWPRSLAPTPIRPAQAAPAQDLSVYAGVYRHPVMGDLKVTVSGQGLLMTCGPKQIPINLAHWSGDAFSASIPYLLEDGGLVYFLMSTDRRPGKMLIPMFTNDGGQEAVRVR
jgi:CubicO group peptidase (beta-lactamase class C family)